MGRQGQLLLRVAGVFCLAAHREGVVVGAGDRTSVSTHVGVCAREVCRQWKRSRTWREPRARQLVEARGPGVKARQCRGRQSKVKEGACCSHRQAAQPLKCQLACMSVNRLS